MKELFFVLFLFSSAFCFGQDHPHASIWKDEHTIRHHSTQYLSNMAGQRDYMRHWDDSLQSFVSSIPDNLTYLPAANRTLEITHREIDYRDEYQLWKWDEFTPERFDSILERNKVIGEVEVKYDKVGRLLFSVIKNKEHALIKDRKTYTFEYSDNGEEDVLKYQLYTKKFYWFARYQSSNLGNFRFRPLRLRTAWSIDYTFDKKGRMILAKELSSTKANQRKTDVLGHRFLSAIWDSKGRLLQRCHYSDYDSIVKITEQQFRERPLDLKAEQNNYTILKTPSIAKWISERSKTEKLKIVDYAGEGNSGEYIVNEKEEPLLSLWKTEKSRKILYQTIVDSNSIYRSQFEIYKFPDTSDIKPYDPKYKPHVTEVRHTQCSIETYMSRPPGMIDARSASGFKKSYQKLNGGWTLIRYERGTSDGQTRFAVGYNPHVRLDILSTKYVILNPEGKVQYFGGYRKMAKVNW